MPGLVQAGCPEDLVDADDGHDIVVLVRSEGIVVEMPRTVARTRREVTMRPTILVVDDERSTLQGLALLLADAGFRVLTAETYEAAHFALRIGYPDMLLVDIRLGDFNGLQLLATNPRPLPAIVITGHDDPALEREARRFGADYFVKPVTPRSLINAIERRLAEHRVD